MIEKYLYADWTEPHHEMEFEEPFSGLTVDVYKSLDVVLRRLEKGEPNKDEWKFYGHILNIYIKTQAFIRLVLNYKIAVEFGLPLHPTKYFEFSEEPKDPDRYPEELKHQAIGLYLDAISMSKRIYALSAEGLDQLYEFKRLTPDILRDFVYTNRRDKYTWMASNPKDVRALADQLKKDVRDIGLIIGAAHGCIRPGILLANMLDTDIYFLRFSLFKRNDKGPVISDYDLALLERYRDCPAILFDEDVAKGDTMRVMDSTVRPLFKKSYTAAVIRHHLAGFRPDFVGNTFYDFA